MGSAAWSVRDVLAVVYIAICIFFAWFMSLNNDIFDKHFPDREYALKQVPHDKLPLMLDLVLSCFKRPILERFRPVYGCLRYLHVRLARAAPFLIKRGSHLQGRRLHPRGGSVLLGPQVGGLGLKG